MWRRRGRHVRSVSYNIYNINRCTRRASVALHTCGPSLLLSRESAAPILIAPVLRRSFIYCPHRWLWKALSWVYISFSFISCIWSDVWHTSGRGQRPPARHKPHAIASRAQSFSQEKYNGLCDDTAYPRSVRKCAQCYLPLSSCGNTQGVNKKSIIISTKMWAVARRCF